MGIELARTAACLAAGMYDVIGRLAECLLALKVSADVIGSHVAREINENRLTQLAYAQNSYRASLYCCRHQVIYGFALATTVACHLTNKYACLLACLLFVCAWALTELLSHPVYGGSK